MVKTEIHCENCMEEIVIVTREESQANFCPNCGVNQDLEFSAQDDE